MSFPILMSGASTAPPRRVPLHPGDVARYEDQHSEAMSRRQAAFDREMERLSAVAQAKRHYEDLQRPGPVDQEAALQNARKYLYEEGFRPESLRSYDSDVWATSNPESRAAVLHAMAIPENFVYQVSDALSSGYDSSPKTLSERISRIAMAVPGAIYPPAGSAVEPGRDQMYEKLGPIAGTAAEWLMPDPRSAGKAARPAVRLMRAADNAWKNAGRATLVDDAGNVIRQLRVSN